MKAGYTIRCLHIRVYKTTLLYHNEDRQDGYINDKGYHVYGSDDKIRENLLYPIPIYWGGERDDLFDWDEVRRIWIQQD